MSYLYMRECAKEVTESELRGNYRSQSNTVRESYRSQDKLYRSHREGNGSYTAYVDARSRRQYHGAVLRRKVGVSLGDVSGSAQALMQRRVVRRVAPWMSRRGVWSARARAAAQRVHAAERRSGEWS
jgi:hypothetical protein